jgi:hypothetical protein
VEYVEVSETLVIFYWNDVCAVNEAVNANPENPGETVIEYFNAART